MVRDYLPRKAYIHLRLFVRECVDEGFLTEAGGSKVNFANLRHELLRHVDGGCLPRCRRSNDDDVKLRKEVERPHSEGGFPP